MEFRQRLRMILQNENDTISIYDLAKKMNMRVDPMLVKIMEITNDFKTIYKNNVTNMVRGNSDLMDEFFKTEIVDLGFLCQHKIQEIKKNLEKKHNTMGHQMFYDSWILHRGY